MLGEIEIPPAIHGNAKKNLILVYDFFGTIKVFVVFNRNTCDWSDGVLEYWNICCEMTYHFPSPLPH